MHNRLKELRKEKGLTQTELAQVINTNQSQYGKYENGKTNLSLENAKILADYFGVSIPYLFGIDDNRQILDFTGESLAKGTMENDPALERIIQALRQSSFSHTSEKLAHTGLQFLTDYLEETHQLRLAYDDLLEENDQLKQTIASLKADLDRLNQERSDDGA